MNNKGFTMIELLASMVLLSILMLTAVPTVLRVMDNSRRNTIINDASKLVSNVEYKIKHNNNYIMRPKKQNSCILLTLGYLNLGSEFKEGPHGGTYSLDDSYVVVKLKSLSSATSDVQEYDYYVTLVETYDNNSYYGVYLLPYDLLFDKDAKKYVDGLMSDKLFSNNHRKLLKNATVTSKTPRTLDCSEDLVNGTAQTVNDKVYDSNDALREQGVDEVADE